MFLNSDRSTYISYFEYFIICCSINFFVIIKLNVIERCFFYIFADNVLYTWYVHTKVVILSLSILIFLSHSFFNQLPFKENLSILKISSNSRNDWNSKLLSWKFSIIQKLLPHENRVAFENRKTSRKLLEVFHLFQRKMLKWALKKLVTSRFLSCSYKNFLRQ